jgi:two-component system, OmpR family, sensor histidine kinase BaeS
MKFKIWHKLALLLISITTLTVVIGIGLSQYSFKSGFIDYLHQQEQRRLDILANTLLSAYKENGSWEFIRANNRLWFFYLRPRHGRFMQGRGAMHMNNRQPLRNAGSFGFNRKFPPLALLDVNKELIVGLQPPQKKAQYLPIKINDQIIAYLISERFSRITDRLDKMFASKLNDAFLINTLVSFILSVMVALLVSFYFRKRIKSLTQIAKNLTSGQYQHRLEVKQKDELGQLGLDFNILAETLQKNQQSQQQWIADISHELRTPVAILKGELEALDDGIRPLDKSAIKSLKFDVERLRKLIDDLYQLSIADMGALKYIKDDFIFNDLIGEIEDGFAARFDKQNLSFHIDNHLSGQLLFNGDKQRLYQLLSNLLENSLRYTDADGKVVLSCHTDNNDIIIKVEDSAPGISAEKISHIFNRLYRLENSRNRSNGGAGLGLAIAKQIIIAHQGDISAQSSKLGGILLTCRLPK